MSNQEPLSVEQLKEMVGRLLPEWMGKLGCPHWSVSVVYEAPANPQWSASCEREVAYEVATIRLDPASHFTEEDVVRSLVHELLHVKLAVFDLYRTVVTQNRRPGSAADREESALWSFTIEQAVKELRRMVSGLTGFY